MAIDRHAKAREYVAADIRDAATHIEGALRLMSATRWAPADRDRLTTAIRVAYGAVGAARVLVDELTADTPEASLEGMALLKVGAYVTVSRKGGPDVTGLVIDAAPGLVTIRDAHGAVGMLASYITSVRSADTPEADR